MFNIHQARPIVENFYFARHFNEAFASIAAFALQAFSHLAFLFSSR